MSCCVCDRLDVIEAALAALVTNIEAERKRESGHFHQILERLKTMATNQEILQAAVDALATATSQESDLLEADNAKLDKIQALIAELVNTAGVPQAVLDKLATIQSTVGSVASTTAAQAARLDQLGTDPRNPVPTPPPAPTP